MPISERKWCAALVKGKQPGKETAMRNTKELLQKIAALRQHVGPQPAAPGHETSPATDPAEALKEKVEQGTWHNRLIDRTLRAAGSTAAAAPLPIQLTASAQRLLLKGRSLLQALRELANEPAVLGDPQGPFAMLHARAAAMLDSVLRAVQAFPPSPSEQLRLCEGLEGILEAAEEHVATLGAGLNHRRGELERIVYLAEILRRLAGGQPVALPPLQALADTLVQEARAGQPLRLLRASASDPACFAAAHGLTVAQVLVRLILNGAENPTSLQLAVMAALVHDVGMTCVPAAILGKPGPLTDEERRLVERHAAAGGAMVAPLWPGGGWPVEAVTDHHERPDGTGYPLGRRDIQIGAFVRLLAVCDVYAALCCPRPHRGALDTRTALTETLLLAERDVLDRQQAERLLHLSFYPAGSVVELSDGAVALVYAAQPGQSGLTNPSRPVVLLLADAHSQPLPLPRLVDLLQEKDRSIVRGLPGPERRRFLETRYPVLA
jgi:hypothetical protein